MTFYAAYIMWRDGSVVPAVKRNGSLTPRKEKQ